MKAPSLCDCARVEEPLLWNHIELCHTGIVGLVWGPSADTQLCAHGSHSPYTRGHMALRTPAERAEPLSPESLS